MTDKTAFSLFQLTYRHTDDWDLWLQAWQKYPTEKKDCPTTRKFKELARNDYVKKLRKQREEINID